MDLFPITGAEENVNGGKAKKQAYANAFIIDNARANLWIAYKENVLLSVPLRENKFCSLYMLKHRFLASLFLNFFRASMKP